LVGPDQDAGIERPAQDDGDTPAPAGGEKLLLPALLQQGVAPGQQEAVEISLAHRLLADPDLVHPHADGADLSGALQFLQSAIAALHRPLEDTGQLLAMLGLAEIVEQQDIDAVEAEALMASLHRA